MLFRLLIADEKPHETCNSTQDLVFLIASIGSLWKDIRVKNSTISDSQTSIRISVKSNLDQASENNQLEYCFEMFISGNYDDLEPLRLNILQVLANYGFSNIYVVTDEVSQSIATKIYPKINKLESALRSYLLEFFILRLGVKWADVTFNPEMKIKVNKRKNNETLFSKFIDNRAFLVDFHELGQIIFTLSSGAVDKQSILSKIKEMDRTPEAVDKLRREVEPNYVKYFSEHFKNRKFQNKWEKLEKIRHKVAHNNLFVDADLKEVTTLHEELSEIIIDAGSSLTEVDITNSDKRGFVSEEVAKIDVIADRIIEKIKILEGIVIDLLLEINESVDDRSKGLKLNALFLKSNQIIDQKTYELLLYIYQIRNYILHGDVYKFSSETLEDQYTMIDELINNLSLLKNNN